MIELIQITAERYTEIVDRYRRPGCVANDYILSEATRLADEGRLYGICGENNALFIVKNPVGMRVYYYVNNFDERVELPDGDYVIELLFRDSVGLPEHEIEYLERMGFAKNLVRDQYGCAAQGVVEYERTSNVKIESAANLDEISVACQLFNASFDHLSGNYIGEEEFQKLLAEGQILVARGNEGVFLGALHHQRGEKVSWLHHLAVKAEARGTGVGLELCQRWITQDRASDNMRYMLWVQRQNVPAVALYKKMGFKYNGKSSLSLIKRRNGDGKTA